MHSTYNKVRPQPYIRMYIRTNTQHTASTIYNSLCLPVGLNRHVYDETPNAEQ